MFLFWSKQKTCPGAVTSQCGRARPETPSLHAASVPLLTSTSFLLCAAFLTHLTRAWLNYQHPWRPRAQQDSFRKIYFTFLVTLDVSVILIEPMGTLARTPRSWLPGCPLSYGTTSTGLNPCGKNPLPVGIP